MAEYQAEVVADVYRRTFAARLDAYADWGAKPGCDHTTAGCSCHWVATRSELTVGRVVEGLQTRHPVSTYMEDSAGLTHLGAIDFDTPDGWDLALLVAKRLGDAGAYPMIERSRRGGHLWVVLTDTIPGPIVRLGLRYFVEEARPGAGKDPKVEIMPKPLNRTPNSLGNPLRMPMMSHQRTGERHPLCTPDGQPLGGSISSIVLAVELTPVAVLAIAAAKVKLPISEVHVPSWARKPSRESGDVVELLSNVGVARAAPGRTVRCPLHDDQHASMSISRDGERVWCKAPECRAHNSGRGLGADQLAKELAPLG